MDLIEAGIIDPTNVTRTSLQNAASIAGLMSTAECVFRNSGPPDQFIDIAQPQTQNHAHQARKHFQAGFKPEVRRLGRRRKFS